MLVSCLGQRGLLNTETITIDHSVQIPLAVCVCVCMVGEGGVHQRCVSWLLVFMECVYPVFREVRMLARHKRKLLILSNREQVTGSD